MSNLHVKSAFLAVAKGPNDPMIIAERFEIPGSGGTVFCIIKVLGQKNETRTRLIEAVVDNLRHFQDSLNSDTNIPRRFEQILQTINQDIALIIDHGSRVPISDFHTILGVQHQNQIFVSGVGNLMALFMHRTSGQRFSIFELDQQFNTGEAPTWQKLFLTVLDGELHKGDIFYAATRIPAREISLAELQDILVMLPPSGALERIQQYLQIGSAYGGVCFQIKENESSGPPKKTNPMHSIEQLGRTKDDTANILGEQSPDFRAWLTGITAPLLNKLSAPGTRGFKSMCKRLSKNCLKLIVTIIIFIHAFGKRLAQTTGRGSKMMVNVYQKSKKTKDNPEQTKKSSQKIKEKFDQIPKVSRWIALGAFLTLVLLIGSVSLASKNKTRNQTEETFTTVIDRIEEKKDAAEASLIYNDNEQARELLNEAVALLESLQPDSKTHEEEIARLSQEINTVFDSMRGISATAMTIEATLPDNESFVSIVEVAGQIYGPTESSAVFRFDELEQSLVSESITSGSIGQITQTAPYTDGFIFVDNNQRLGRANLSLNTLNPITSGVETMSSVEDIATYNNNLYALTAQGEQVVKMQPQSDSFDAGTNWITANNNSLTSARALAIDGSIFILLNNNIVQFTSGREDQLNLDTVDPALHDATDLWTATESDYLYVFEPAEGRVLVFEKNGGFVTQYVADALREAIGFIVRESNKKIIVATPSQLISFTADHLLQ